MKPNYFMLSCALLITGLSLRAQPIHAYELNNSYADTYGGTMMVPNGGVLTTTSYVFGLGEGPAVNSAIDPYTYSIVMKYTPYHTDYWAKVLDFKDRTSDNGIYITDNRFMFYIGDPFLVVYGSDVLFPDVPAVICLTRDGASKEVRGYVNGVMWWSFIDDTDEAAFTGPANIIHIGIDDIPTENLPGHDPEHADGELDYVRIYDYVLTDPDLISPPFGSEDSDCDGIIDDHDICTGGDDNGPCYALTLPLLENLPANWLCNNNNNSDKVLICHDGTTLCVSENAANTHLAHGDFLGPCKSCAQNYSVSEITSPAYESPTPEIELSPNPVVDHVTIQWTHPVKTTGTLIVSDATGRVVYSREIQPGVNLASLGLDENLFPPGIYYAGIVENGLLKAKRFIVAR